MGLHRLEINVRPENTASLRVVDKLGFRDEGVRRRFLHIAGDWRDHRTFALTAEEVPDGLLNRWLQRSGNAPDCHSCHTSPTTDPATHRARCVNAAARAPTFKMWAAE